MSSCRRKDDKTVGFTEVRNGSQGTLVLVRTDSRRLCLLGHLPPVVLVRGFVCSDKRTPLICRTSPDGQGFSWVETSAGPVRVVTSDCDLIWRWTGEA